MSSFAELARESQRESIPEIDLENSKESPLMKLSNGSLKRWLELSFDQKVIVFETK